MAMIDDERTAENALLVSRMRVWASFEDQYEPFADEVVARKLPRLLELADALPRRARQPLMFPPIGGGPSPAVR